MRATTAADLIKMLAVIFVISGHSVSMDDENWLRGFHSINDGVWKCLVFLLSQIGRFAVPFFFVLSGYLWGRKSRRGIILNPNSAIVINRAKRIFYIFFAWSVVYAFPFDLLLQMFSGETLVSAKIMYWRLLGLASDPLSLVNRGTKGHLWYLPALLWAIAITSLLASRGFNKTLVVFSIGLYVIGILGKSYSPTSLGFYTDFNTRNGPFFSTIFFTTGYLMSYMSEKSNWAIKGFGVFLFGFLIHLSELYFLWSAYHINPLQDYVFGTYFMGLGAALIAIGKNSFKFKSKFISSVGTLALGIYAIHFIFVDILKQTNIFINPFRSIAYVFLVLVLSLKLAEVLSKHRYTRRLVQ